ncbi:MAG: alpha/beta hydrolase [Acidimicrobiales bacterium]|nr:alpha/beta hydrolase [Acidimicrobiales bacterium]
MADERCFDEVIPVPVDIGHVAVHRRAAPGRPVALMSHGTGFCATTWTGVAELLADEFELCSIDRRGHGASGAPDDAYEIADFARDAVAVIDALDLHDAYAVGHSAGATDLLLAAADRPHAFRRLFVVEPTAMDPAEPGIRADMAPSHDEALTTFARRRATFASRRDVLERYAARGVFAGWRRDLLEAYVRDGFADTPSGEVTLRCTPAHEVAMLRRIFAAMEGTMAATDDGHVFDALARVERPTLVVTTEHSQPIYRTMADVVRRLVPGATHLHLDGLGHAAAQVDPARVGAAVRRFWHADDA